MMASMPSIGDALGVCRFAWDTYTSLRNAPSGFKEVARDCRELHGVLAQVDEQQNQPWAPMNRSRQSREAMRTCVDDCDATLHELMGQLKKYQSLGTNAPKTFEKARYITENFGPLRSRMEQQRSRITTQLTIGTNDTVGRILQLVQRVAADMKAGRRQRTIIARYHEEDDEDDTWTAITEQMELEDIPKQDLEKHRSEIEPYVRRLQTEGAFDEDPSDRSDYTALRPEDSISDVDKQARSYSVTQQRHLSLTTSRAPTIANFRGQSIYERSYQTIFNPHYTLKGIKRPGTFDLWELAELSWDLQRRCTNGIAGLSADQDIALNLMMNELTKMDNVFIILLAHSSTDKSFWIHYAKVPAPRRLQRSVLPELSFISLFDHYKTFFEIGGNALNIFRNIAGQIGQAQRPNSPLSTPISLIENSNETSSKVSRSPFARFRPPGLLKNRSAVSTATSVAPMSQGTNGFSRLDTKASFWGIPGPEEWLAYVKEFKRTISYFTDCVILQSRRMSPLLRMDPIYYRYGSIIYGPHGPGMTTADFITELRRIQDSWCREYIKAQNLHSRNTAELDNDTTLLMSWLLSSQGVDHAVGDAMERITYDLSFDDEFAREIRRTYEAIVSRTAQAIDKTYPGQERLPPGWKEYWRSNYDGKQVVVYLNHKIKSAQMLRPGSVQPQPTSALPRASTKLAAYDAAGSYEQNMDELMLDRQFAIWGLAPNEACEFWKQHPLAGVPCRELHPYELPDTKVSPQRVLQTDHSQVTSAVYSPADVSGLSVTAASNMAVEEEEDFYSADEA